MIICFEGTPGSGKSYESVLRIIDNLRQGRQVYCYLDGIEYKECRELIGVYTELYGQIDEKLHYWSFKEVSTVDFEKLPENSFIVIDEVHKFFGNRDWNTEKNKKFADYCSTHRHFTHDILLITQSIEGVDNAVRRLIEWTYRYRKMNFLGPLGNNKYIEYVFPQDDTTTALNQVRKSYKSRYFPCYKSYVKDGLKEKAAIKGANIFKHPVFYAIPVVLFLVVYFGMGSSIVSGDIFGTEKLRKQKTEKLSGSVKADLEKKASKEYGLEVNPIKDGSLTESKDSVKNGLVESLKKEKVVSDDSTSQQENSRIWHDDMEAAFRREKGKKEGYTVADKSGRVTGYVIYH